MPAGDRGQCPAPFERIESASPPELGLAFRAELERLPVALLGVIRAVHAALVGDAMPDAEHVPRLVRRRHRRSHGANPALAGAAIRVSIARHRPHADTLLE